jgi:hypothetical protein
MAKRYMTHVTKDGVQIHIENMGKARVTYSTIDGKKVQVGYKWFRENVTRIPEEN